MGTPAGGRPGEANLSYVKRTLKLLLASLTATALVGGTSAPGGASPLPIGDANNFLFAGGGTPVTNGLFFPGGAICDGDDCTGLGPPLTIDKGDDVTFVNLDPGPVTNTHQIVSFDKRKKNRGPLFASENVSGPGTTVLKMSHVKPGTYLYLCTVHFGMYGQIEVVK